MARYVEFEGKNLEAALEKASKQLNISIDKIKHDVISHGSSGIFGLVGAKKARIRVSMPRESRPEAITPLPAREKKINLARKGSDAVEALVIEPDPGPAQNTDDVIPPVDEVQSAPVAVTVIGDPSTRGIALLEAIVGAITDDAVVGAERSDGRLLFRINGGDSSLLIGKRGQTLEAIQYLLEKSINKQGTDRLRVQVDVEGYIEKRIAYLRQTAERQAERVQKTGRPQTIGIMNAHDRRVVHLALKDNSAVRTQSLGSGFYRKLMIFPRKKTDRPSHETE